MCVLKNILVDNLYDMQFIEDLLIEILKKMFTKEGYLQCCPKRFSIKTKKGSKAKVE